MRRINGLGLTLLKTLENCKLNAYQDEGGIWTLGWGHTGPEVIKGASCTQEMADALLGKDLAKFYELDNFVSEAINDNQYSALICLAYNVGLSAVIKSKTLKLANAGESPDVEWLGFDLVNGQKSDGLLNRRKAELGLYHHLG